MKFVTYSKSTGDVISYIDVPSEKHAMSQVDDTRGVLPVDQFPKGDHVVENGKIKKGVSKEKADQRVGRAKFRAKAEITHLADKMSSGEDSYESKADAKKAKVAQEYISKPSKVPKMLQEVAQIKGTTVSDLAEEWAKKETRSAMRLEDAEVVREKYLSLLKEAQSLDDIDRILGEAKAEFGLVE